MGLCNTTTGLAAFSLSFSPSLSLSFSLVIPLIFPVTYRAISLLGAKAAALSGPELLYRSLGRIGFSLACSWQGRVPSGTRDSIRDAV